MRVTCQHCGFSCDMDIDPQGWTFETDCDKCGRVIPSVCENPAQIKLLGLRTAKIKLYQGSIFYGFPEGIVETFLSRLFTWKGELWWHHPASGLFKVKEVLDYSALP